MPTEKKCHKCGEVKPIDQFSKCSRNKDKLTIWCRACNKEYMDNYKPKHNRKNHASATYSMKCY